ncbi:UNVERIFIED_CONTAM: hypothetical protein HDU68_004960 [Siphonaria sp. JEL0065]|nr:hypothetical protein HDU68_004960 [Siphonaria sp. JEL0065]
MQPRLILALLAAALAPTVAAQGSVPSTSTTTTTTTIGAPRPTTTGTAPAPGGTGTAAPQSTGLAQSGVTIGGAPVAATAPVTRFGATAHWIADQGVILFFGGWTGSWNVQTSLTVDQAVAALSLRNAGFGARLNPTWLSVPVPGLVNAPANSIDPRITSYGVSALARSVDVGMSGPNVNVLYYMFGNSNNPTTSAVYQYIPSNAATIQTYNNHTTSASPRVRSASCLLDPSTLIIHGGADGIDGGSKTQTIQGTYFLSLTNATTPNNAWTAKPGSDSDPLLHDHSMACVAGIAYMVGGIQSGLNADGTMVGASLASIYVYTYTNNIVGGSWKNQTVSPDPQYGYPQPRRSATLTPDFGFLVNPSSNILLYHGGVAPDISISYGDLWQLDTNTFIWKQLNPAPQVRHSHNAVAVNNYLVVAFGIISNGSDPNPPIPGLIAYDISKGTWGDMLSAAPFGAPSPLPTHVNVVPSPSPGGDGGNGGITLPMPAVYGLAGGGGALLLIIIAVLVFKKRKVAKSERDELEQRMTDRLHREDTDRQLALQGILGSQSAPHAGRQVGGELARVIMHNQTGVRSTGLSSTDDSDDETTEEDAGVYKFGMKVGLNDEPSKLPNTMRNSYASGLSYPSGSGVSTGESSDGESEAASSTHGSGRISNVPASPQLSPSIGDGAKKQQRSSILDTVSKRSGSRNAVFPKDEPLRPWELPGMGTLKPQGVGSRSSLIQAPNRSPLVQNIRSRSPLVTDHGHSPKPYTPTAAADVREKRSRFSLNSSIRSSEGSVQGENFDESQYMRSLFNQFTDEQILESWNSYVMYTGQVYTIEQIVALRTLYGNNPTRLSTLSTNSTSALGSALP